MVGRRRWLGWLVGVVTALSVVAVAACGSGEDAASTPVSTATEVTIPIKASIDIRSVEFFKRPDVVAAVREAGGEPADVRVVFADLTGDGEEEAVVSIPSGGTLGDLGFMVFRAEGAMVVLALDQAGIQSRAEVVNGRVVQTEPVYGPGDANCCPSQLRETVYGWDGQGFVVVSRDTMQGEPAKE